MDGVDKVLEQEFNERFDKQRGADGQSFPHKKKPNKAKSQKYLKDTGKMVKSLHVEQRKHNTVTWYLKDKSDVY